MWNYISFLFWTAVNVGNVEKAQISSINNENTTDSVLNNTHLVMFKGQKYWQVKCLKLSSEG